VTARARVGIVGCGVISQAYAENAAAFDRFEIVSCADRDPLRSEALAAAYGLASTTVDALLAAPDLDLVLNLTPPEAHAEVTRAALESGKHVYSEKPLAMTGDVAAGLLDLADRQSLRVACAPDVFLGGAYQEARTLIDGGAIGRPLGVSATMLAGGQEAWHPDPDIFFRDGAGPLLDMGPYYLTAIVALLGPVVRVAGFTSTLVTERTIEIGPRRGERFTAETPTHTTAALELEGGVTATLLATFEAPSHYSSTFLVLGSEGTLHLPDPNVFGETLRLRAGRGGWEEHPYRSRGAREARGIGLQDLVEAIAEDREPRASGRLALHVIDVARSVLAAAEAGVTVKIDSSAERPEPLPVEGPAAATGAVSPT
jgi:predicted dehydrogenase